MLDLGSHLDLDELVALLDNDMHRTVAVAWFCPPIDNRRTVENSRQSLSHFILSTQIGDNQTAPGNVLNLTEANALAAQLVTMDCVVLARRPVGESVNCARTCRMTES